MMIEVSPYAADALGGADFLLSESYDGPRILRVSLQIVCIAAVATRQPLLRHWDKGSPPGGVGGNLLGAWPCQTTGFTTGVSGAVLWADQDAIDVLNGTTQIVVTPASIVLFPGDRLTLSTANFQAGDNILGNFLIYPPDLIGSI